MNQSRIYCYRDLLLMANSIEREPEEVQEVCREAQNKLERDLITQEQLDSIYTVLMNRFVVVK